MQNQQKGSILVWPYKIKKESSPSPNVRLDGRQTEMSSSAWQWQWSYRGWHRKNKSAVLPYQKASVCSLPCVPTHVETITVAVRLMGLSWSSQLDGRASSSSTYSETAIRLSTSKRWNQWHRQKDAGKQEGQSQEQQTCLICKWMHCFKCQVLIWAASKLLRRHVRLCKTKCRWFTSSW